MASIGIGFLGEPALVDLFEPWLDGPSPTASRSPIAFVIAYTLATSLHITVGEQVPKMLAITNADRTVARAVAAAALVRGRERPVHDRADHDLQRHRPPVRRRPDGPRRAATPPTT